MKAAESPACTAEAEPLADTGSTSRSTATHDDPDRSEHTGEDAEIMPSMWRPVLWVFDSSAGSAC